MQSYEAIRNLNWRLDRLQGYGIEYLHCNLLPDALTTYLNINNQPSSKERVPRLYRCTESNPRPSRQKVNKPFVKLTFNRCL